MRHDTASPIHVHGALGSLPTYVLDVIDAIEAAGHEAWLVGGFVRDALRGAEPHDADLATDALWTDVRDACAARGFAVHETGVAHGTVTVVAQGHALEVTTFRSEEGYSDHRHPDSVRFVKNIEQDLARRDFTINAMAFHPVRGIVDPFDGQHDLVHGVIRCVGDPQKRFAEDALRILRAARFASQLSFWLAPDTERAANACAHTLNEVAGERLSKEFELLLCGEGACAALMRFADILAVIMPALARMKGFNQHSRWHVYDVLEHTAHVVAAVPAYPLVRWAALFHDSGKPDTFIRDKDGVGHMPGHPLASVEHLRSASARLHFSRRRQHDLTLLVRHHDDHPAPTPAGVRALFAKLEGDERLFHVMCDLMRGDALGQAEFSHARVDTIDAVEQLFNEMRAAGEWMTAADLPVTGADLIALGVPEGPHVGLLLGELFSSVMNERIAAEREALLAYARSLIADKPLRK